jgi:hypothetical protein
MRISNRKRAWNGRECGEVARLVLILLAVGALALALPYLLSRRVTVSKNSCVANLMQIDGAKKQWALEHRKGQDDTPTWADLVGEGKYLRVKPACHVGGSYTIGQVGVRPTCGATTNGFPDHMLQNP